MKYLYIEPHNEFSVGSSTLTEEVKARVELGHTEVIRFRGNNFQRLYVWTDSNNAQKTEWRDIP